MPFISGAGDRNNTSAVDGDGVSAIGSSIKGNGLGAGLIKAIDDTGTAGLPVTLGLNSGNLEAVTSAVFEVLGNDGSISGTDVGHISSLTRLLELGSEHGDSDCNEHGRQRLHTLKSEKSTRVLAVTTRKISQRHEFAENDTGKRGNSTGKNDYDTGLDFATRGQKKKPTEHLAGMLAGSSVGSVVSLLTL